MINESSDLNEIFHLIFSLNVMTKWNWNMFKDSLKINFYSVDDYSNKYIDLYIKEFLGFIFLL